VLQAMAGIQLTPAGLGPLGPQCNGPLGPGPCDQVRLYLAMLQVAQQEFQLPSIGMDPMQGPICIGPLGPGPCNAILIYLMQTDGGAAPLPNFDLRQVQLSPVQGPGGVAMCSAPSGNMPCAIVAQAGLDRMGGSMPTQASFELPGGLHQPQQIAAACAQRIGLDVAAFAACTGQQIILPESQHRVLDCAVSSTSAKAFGECAAPELGIKLSDEQRVLVGCAEKSRGNTQAFAQCAGGALASGRLGQNEQAILRCASGGRDLDSFTDCVAPYVLKRDQEAVLRCAIGSSSVSLTTPPSALLISRS
jgi:hypothetical protein